MPAFRGPNRTFRAPSAGAVTSDPRAFFAIDQGAATTSAAIVGRAAGRWRLLTAAAFPSSVEVEPILSLLVERLVAADRGLAASLGADEDAVSDWTRLGARGHPSRRLAVVAASDRALAPFETAAERTGWSVTAGSAERFDPLAMTTLLLDPELDAVLVGAGEPPGADERSALDELGALAAAVAGRRPELAFVLAGSMADQQGRFDALGDRGGEIILGPAATAGDLPGGALRALLEGLRAPEGEGRRAIARAAASIADALDRRIEIAEIGFGAGLRVAAAPSRGNEPGDLLTATVAAAGIGDGEVDEALVDRVLSWSTQSLDRHRLRDQLGELRVTPWGDCAGDGAFLRLAVGRAALEQLVEGTPEFARLAPPDVLVAAGGVWAVAPGPVIALALADIVRRAGASQLAFDHARLLGPLGTIEDVAERRAVLGDIAGDLLAPIGSVVMPQGLRMGRQAGRLTVHGASGTTDLDLTPGTLDLVDLPPGETAIAEFQFRDAVQLGTRGRHFAIDVAGGLGGLLVDLRDVPLRLPDRQEPRRELLASWQEALWSGLDG